MAAGNCWRENFGRAERITNGAIRKCCNRFGERVWRDCGAKWNRLSKATFARFLTRWQGVTVKRRGLDALLDAIEKLQGTALLASELEREILPARLAGFSAGDLDMLMAAGEVVWVGVEQIGDRDGRVALYLTDSLPLLFPPEEFRGDTAGISERAQKIEEFLGDERGFVFCAGACSGWRVPARDAGSALGTCVVWPGDERYVSSVAQLAFSR